MTDIIAEHTTGIRERVVGGGCFYDDAGHAISDSMARRIIRKGETVECPNAGAGSYREIARRLGFKKVEVEDWTSSAGDWCFKVQGGRLLFQTNRYPCAGFHYTLAKRETAYDRNRNEHVPQHIERYIQRLQDRLQRSPASRAEVKILFGLQPCQ